jgi:glucokinase
MPRLCIDFGGTEIKLGLLDDGEIRAATALAPTDSEADLEHVRRAAKELGGPVDGVGIAVPGVVDHAAGALVAAHDKYGWAHGRDLVAWATDAFAVPAAIENDARAALLGEVAFGAARGARDAVLVTLGTGIGTAAMIGGELVRGRHGHAGILGGHVTVDLDGPACNCGNVGCAEAVASTWALARDAAADPQLAAALSRSGEASVGLKSLFTNASDPVVAATLDRYLRAWGAAVVGMCHAYDPDVVVVSGGVLRAADVVMPALTDYVATHLWSSSHRPVLVAAAAPEHSVLLGLSALALAPRKDAA